MQRLDALLPVELYLAQALFSDFYTACQMDMNIHQAGDQVFVLSVDDSRALTLGAAELSSFYFDNAILLNQHTDLFYRLSTGPID